MANAYGIRGGGEPLFFFYDCEATGLRIGWDVIIEVAAVLHTKDLRHKMSGPQEFSSLCRSSKELHPEAEKLTGLTKYALRNEPTVQDVLHRFFDWIRDTVDTVSRTEGRAYIPVLAAHSGRRLDFPMLFTAVGRIGAKNPSLKIKFDDLNFHYADTYSVFRETAEKNKLEKFGLKDVYKAFFGHTMDGHRALADAKALCRIFSDAPPAVELLAVLRQYVQSREGTEIARKQIGLFHGANIKVPKAVELLQRKITYQDLEMESQMSEESFTRYLKEKCGITDPEEDLLEHFRGLRLD